ncbi:MAG: NAD(P)/FAD-dependent oxidoreductase [Gomphosphaeria aponina SAG 52.96 = DSM 107014]|uniref:NAD(P)/FAD-dependent oxidoreductase n=1 Tax=Gomphosphaeria aponina SAG 52.96 = DSM 107014 TaxID=1521640 RepID=A0A941GUX1_9CHRO|nr:NAD(P)/FAD-dependent oxidoreductase [Gomphosphaeria aponina SAG 52.96 = DSM 107014]
MSILNQQISANITNNKLTHQIVIVGGGAAGITVAAQLLKKDRNLDLAIIEPSEKHYYQPAWTLVGGGQYQIENAVKDEQDCIPNGAKWIKAYVEKFDPDHNLVITRDRQEIKYNYLIVCPGIQIDWHLIQGLKEAIGKDGVTSNYSKDYAPYTWESINKFSGGNAIFTYPVTPIKCGGAAQKIMYMTDETLRKRGVRNKSNIIFCTPGAKMFGVPEYSESLDKVIKEKNIEVKFKHNLKAIKPETKEAIFTVNTGTEIEEISIKYDLLHVTPPMSAPEFIKNSKLAVQNGSMQGWVDVNQYTLQHNLYANVFSLGDVAGLPTSKTAAAIRKQAPVVVKNILSLIQSRQVNEEYNGYTCCPLITGYGKVIMAEFNYENKPISSFLLNPTKPRYSMWLVKRYALPWLYWNRMLKGEPFEPDILRELF